MRGDGKKTEVELLTCKLEASAAKLEASELMHEVARLKEAVSMLEKELILSNKQLRKQRFPPRQKMSFTEKALIAASQKWQCYGVDGQKCPLSLTNAKLFDGSLYEIHHLSPYSRSGKDGNSNKCALCPHCHSYTTRREIVNNMHRRVEESDSGSGEE